MADRKDAPKNSPRKDETAHPAREALLQGDSALARKLASAVLADPTASDDAKAAAREVLDSTRIDRQALVAGVIVFAVLALLFTLVLAGRF